MDYAIIGLIGSGFKEAIKEKQKEEEIKDNANKELEPDRKVDRFELKIKNIGYSDYKL